MKIIEGRGGESEEEKHEVDGGLMVAKTVKVGPKHVLHVLFSRIINKFHAKKIQIGKSYNLQNSTKLSYYLHLPL